MKKRIRFTAALVIGIVLVILIAYTAIGQDGETMTLAEVVELTAETLMELQKTVERIADTAADKTEVHALETRVAALETAMPRPTATAMPRPTATSTPQPGAFSRLPPAMAAVQFARLLAIDDYAASRIKFSDLSMFDQAKIGTVYWDFFVKTVEVCELDAATTFEILQKHAQDYDKPRGALFEGRAQRHGIAGAGWRFEFIRRIAEVVGAQVEIGFMGCDGYLEWYTSK